MKSKKSQIEKVDSCGNLTYDMESSIENPCLDCGACCNHFRISFYFGETDYFKKGGVPQNLTTKLNDHYACMLGTEKGNGRCIALKGIIGETGISCSIYANRPSVCRSFQVYDEYGYLNPKCVELRNKNNII